MVDYKLKILLKDLIKIKTFYFLFPAFSIFWAVFSAFWHSQTFLQHFYHPFMFPFHFIFINLINISIVKFYMNTSAIQEESQANILEKTFVDGDLIN